MVSINQRLARYDRPVSRAGELCQQLAIFAVPYLAIVVAGHRFGLIDTVPTFWLLGLGVIIALVAIAYGVRGFYELWTRGHEAGRNAARGTVLASVLLLPFIWYGAVALALPPLHDIATDLEDVPEYDAVLELRDGSMNPLGAPSPAQRLEQLNAYPKVSARRYPLGAGRVFRAVVGQIAERDWTILTTSVEPGNAPIDEEGSGLVARPTVDASGLPLRLTVPTPRPLFVPTKPPAEGEGALFEVEPVSPVGRGDDEDADGETATDEAENEERYVEAVATSLIFGFPSDIVIRLIEEEEGTLVDMRSSSRYGPHDLGANAKIVTEFMDDLDLALQGLGS